MRCYVTIMMGMGDDCIDDDEDETVEAVANLPFAPFHRKGGRMRCLVAIMVDDGGMTRMMARR